MEILHYDYPFQGSVRRVLKKKKNIAKKLLGMIFGVTSGTLVPIYF